VLVDQGRPADAVPLVQELCAAGRGPPSAADLHRLALVRLAAGDRDGYQHLCADLLKRFGQAADVATLRSVCRTCTLAANGVADPARLLPLCAKADSLTRGAVLCRAGRPDQAVEALAEARAVPGYYFRALAEYDRHQPDEARRAMQQAASWLAAPAK
jgi:hypothetical protein